MSYIYVRTNENWHTHNIYKLGISTCIPDRENGYITNEYERGQFISVIQIFDYNLKFLDKGLKYKFQKHNRYIGGGTEFFDKSIISEIEPYLQKKKISYKVLSKDEIKTLQRKYRAKKNLYIKIRKALRNLNVKKAIEISKIIIPYKYQQDILDDINNFFSKNNIGKIIWACGLGKALLAILIAKHCNFKSIVIGVPSVYLQTQMLNEVIKIFPDINKILLIGGDNEKSTTKPQIIAKFKENNKDFHILITTYDSCKLLTSYTFDYKVGDESHHLVGNIDGEYNNFHKIVATKTIFMTATTKIIKGDKVFSMDNQEQFGKIIDEKSVQWAIDNGKIADYKVCIIKSTTKEIYNIIQSLNIELENKDIFIACYMALLSITKYSDLTHQVLYTNTIATANLAKKYIDILLDKLFKFENIYNESLHSKSGTDLHIEVDKFKKAKYGIISCVYILGEGFDLPKLNGECFAENMESEIRIVQCAMRANRLDKSFPDKIAYIILPYIDDGNWCENSDSYDKIRKILSHLRNNDANIEHKISVLTVNEEKNVATKKEEEDKNSENILLENIEELTKLKIRLRHSKCLTSDFTEEEDEYNYIKECNKELNIQSKEEYVATKNKNYIEDAENYFKKKGVWKNWYDFLGVDTKIFIESKEEWIKFCKDKVKSLDDYQNLCIFNKSLPRNPGDFYNHFTNISNELELYHNIYY